MARIEDSDAQQVLGLIDELSFVAPELLTEVALPRIRSMLSAELAGLNEINFQTGSAAITSSPTSRVTQSLAPRLATTALDHPIVRHFSANPTAPIKPLRISDILSSSEWLKSRTYNEVIRPMGTPHMLVIPMQFSSTRASAYTALRSGRDFTDRERSIADAIQSIMATLHKRDRFHLNADQDAKMLRQLPMLTSRENEVFYLLTRACTADSISRKLSISPATVRKHLEHIYRKLGVTDRLAAVNWARGQANNGQHALRGREGVQHPQS